MAVNDTKFRQLMQGGLSWEAARVLADPTQDAIEAAAVSDPAALTAPADIAATYTEAQVQALRNDIAALRTTVAALLTSLRDAGVLSS